MAEITTSSSLAPAADPAPSASATTTTTTPVLPRVTIRFCTQCKWMLRAAYYAQELLSTFSTGLGEVALQPATGGTFIVEILASSVTPSPDDAPQPQPGSAPAAAAATQHRVLWDRTVDGGFPETKELKRRVRDVIEPNRDLGHVDRDHAKKPKAAAAAEASSSSSVPATAAAAAPPPPQESILTSSSSSTPTVVRDTPRQGQSQPRKPVAAAGPAPGDDDNSKNVDPQQISSAAPGNVCEDCQ